MDITKCDFCDKMFKHRKTMYAHVRKVHDRDPLSTKNYKCDLCYKKFTTIKTLHQHTQNFHNCDNNLKEIRQTRIICPLSECEEQLYTLVKQRTHLTEKHGIEIEFEETKFDSITGNFFN